MPPPHERLGALPLCLDGVPRPRGSCSSISAVWFAEIVVDASPTNRAVTRRRSPGLPHSHKATQSRETMAVSPERGSSRPSSVGSRASVTGGWNLKPGQSEVGDLAGRLELRPVTYAVQPLIPPLVVHVPAAVDHLVLGEVLVLARPYPEGRDSAALPPSYDRREVVGPVPVEPSGKPTGPRQVRDGLRRGGITTTCERAKPTEVVSSEPTRSDAWNLPEQHVVG